MGGQVLATYNTGIIPPTAQPQWNKYGTYFVTPAGVTDVVVKMINNAPGGNGNDLWTILPSGHVALLYKPALVI